MRIHLSGLLGALFAVLPSLATPQSAPSDEAPLYIQAERVIVRPGRVLEDAGVLVEGGRIIAVGKDLEVPQGARQLEGRVVCAGFIDPWSIFGVDPAAAQDQRSEAATQTTDGLDAYVDERLRAQLLRSGVTAVRAQVGATSRVGGVGALVRNHPGHSAEESVVLDDCCVSMSVGLNRGGRTADVFDRLTEVERLTSMISDGEKYMKDQLKHEDELAKWKEAIAEKEKELEDGFKKAKKDRDKKKADAEEKGKDFKEARYKEDRKPKAPKFSAEKEVLARVAKGELPLIIEVHRVAELRALLAGTERFANLRLIVAGGTEALSVAPTLAERDIPVIVWPIPRATRVPDEFEGGDLALAGQLADAGVTVLLGSGARNALASRDLPLLASLAIGHGLDRDEALEALTIGAASALDVSDRIGSVELGKHADLLVLDGDPLMSTTNVQYVIASGDVVYSPED